MSNTSRASMARASVAAALIVAAVLGWGWWRASTHAAVNIRIDDDALRTDRQRDGAPSNATVELLDADKVSLAVARSTGAPAYPRAFHPDAKIGDCSQFEGLVQRDAYARCFEAHSRWVARWAPRVRYARVTIDGCVLRDAPVTVEASKPDWWLWWVPLPHVGGTPLGDYAYSIAIDSGACKAHAPD